MQIDTLPYLDRCRRNFMVGRILCDIGFYIHEIKSTASFLYFVKLYKSTISLNVPPGSLPSLVDLERFTVIGLNRVTNAKLSFLSLNNSEYNYNSIYL